MAQLLPLFLDTGSIEVITGSKIIDYIHFPVTASISSSYITLLPDPYLVATMSADVLNALTATSSSLFEFKVPNRKERYFYIHNSIVGVRTTATTTGVRIGLQTDNPADAIANIKVSSTLTAHTIACIGSQSPTTFALPASMAAINTTYPSFVKGLYNNPTSSSELRNIILLQPETNNGVTGSSGSVSYNNFAGYSSSAEIVNKTSIPLYLFSGSLKQISGSDTLVTSSLPLTSSFVWLSQSLATNVANTSNVGYATVFTLTGLQTGKTYLANLYIIGTSANAATGFRMRVITGSSYRGTLYTPTSTTAPAIQNSADGINIVSITAGNWPIVNTKYLVSGEYTFVKGAQDPQVQILSETNGTAVTAFSGSVIYYRALD